MNDDTTPEEMVAELANLASMQNNIAKLFPLMDRRKRLALLKHIRVLENSAEKQGKFDAKSARSVREHEKIARYNLTFKVGLQEMQIFFYETGVKNPADRLDDAGTKAYLLWLKEKGYNPFDL